MKVVRAKRLLCAALVFMVTLLMTPVACWAAAPAGVLGLAAQTESVDCAPSGSSDAIDESVAGDLSLVALQGPHGDRHHRCERARHQCMQECRHHGGHHNNHRHCFERCMRHHGCHHD